MTLSKTNTFVRRPARRSRHGFTLLEVGFALSIMALLLLAASELYLTAARNTVGTGARVQTTLDASNGLQYVLINARQANSYAVPGDAAWQSPRGAAADYLSGAVNAGVQLKYDNRVTTQPTLCVTSCVGGTASVPLYDINQPTAGQTLWVYRSNADGTPNASSGMYLHGTVRPAGVSGGASDTNFTLARSIQTTRTDAVSFVKSGTDTKNFQAEIVSAAYAGPTQGAVTDESAGGLNAAPLTCKSIRLRN